MFVPQIATFPLALEVEREEMCDGKQRTRNGAA